MNLLDDKICEQLSAWMDGELSKEEAMFLERRLQHDEALQAMYARMQIGSACMKGHSARVMPNALCANIRQALAAESSPVKSRRPLFAWAAAASLAFAAIVFIPGMMQGTSTPKDVLASRNTSATIDTDPPASFTAPTFASADLVANTPDAVSTSVVASSIPIVATASTTGSSTTGAGNGVVSPEDFELNVSSEKKTWPRSPVNANSDPALEAYLVRHNQMMAQDGMGGFVPYVDVVAQDAEPLNKNSTEKTDENPGDNQ